MKRPNAARLIIADSEHCADLYWATRFYVPDPIIYLEFRGKKILVAPDLEISRAKKEAAVDLVLSFSEYDKRFEKSGKKAKEGDVLDRILRERKIRVLQVPSTFPVRQAFLLKKKGYRIEPIADPFFPGREIKSAREKSQIVETLRATEAGIQAAIDLLRRSKIKAGKIYFNGRLLTSEKLRTVIELKMMERGALGQHTIVACGRQAAEPHCRGFGPLYANQTIVMDVFPKSVSTGYYGDISRTVLKGKASTTLKKMYTAVRRAQENGIRTIRAGVDAAKVHAKVAATMEAAGFKTERHRGQPQGFIHSTGHGMGLEIHEPPRLGRLSTKLRKGNVVTVEPGLYYKDLGGIRIEDVVYVTKTGREVLTRLPKVFEIP